MSDGLLDGNRLREALAELGRELGRRRVRAEVNLYGGSAIVLQFEFRESTHDADARIVQGHGAVIEAQNAVADKLGLPRNWLNEQVVPYISTVRDVEGQAMFASYPDYGQPWLVVRVARPEYLIAMKLLASRGASHDLSDATELAVVSGITSEEALLGVVSKYFPHERVSPKVDAAIKEVAYEAARLTAERGQGGPGTP